jgi:hypothetical protein
MLVHFAAQIERYDSMRRWIIHFLSMIFTPLVLRILQNLELFRRLAEA